MARPKSPPKPSPSSQRDRRKTTSTRITPETRARLEEGAAQSGRSLAQEIEFRLERGFMADEGRYSEFRDEETYRFCQLMALTADAITASWGKKWKDDTSWFWFVVGAWEQIVMLRSGKPVDWAGSESDPARAGIERFAEMIGAPTDKSRRDEMRDLGVQALGAILRENKPTERK